MLPYGRTDVLRSELLGALHLLHNSISEMMRADLLHNTISEMMRAYPDFYINMRGVYMESMCKRGSCDEHVVVAPELDKISRKHYIPTVALLDT